MFKLLMCDNAFVQFKRVSASFDNLLRIGSFELCVATFCFTLHRWCLMFMHLLPSKNFVYEPLFYASAVCISHCWAFVCDLWCVLLIRSLWHLSLSWCLGIFRAILV